MADLGLPDGLAIDLLDRVLAQAGVAVWAADDEAHGWAIRHWSPGAEQLYGYAADEALGRSYLDLIVAPDQRARAIADHRRLLSDPHAEILWRTTATDVDAHGAPVPVFYSSFARRSERYGRDLLFEVGIRVPETTVVDPVPVAGEKAVVTSEDQLEAMVDEAHGSAVTDTYRTIVPLLIHRFGNAVDAIGFESTQLSRLLAAAPSPLADPAAERITRIATNADRLGRLLEELDRLSDGVATRSSLNLRQVVESTQLATLASEFRYVEIRNGVDPALTWTTYEVILREVLGTVIVNACEAVTRQAGGGDVEVTAHIDESYGHLVIDIDDDGPGLPRTAFATGRRRPSAKGKAHGRGLLYAERALELLSGRLDLSHAPSPTLGGARVTIVIDEVRPAPLAR
ncbi:MAG TPA: ATP-binding protein [Acidimicrobiales bacterium]